MAEQRPTEVNDVSPTSLGHLIGQRGVVEQVRVALDASQQDGKPFDHALLVGPLGCGKTQTAKVIAAEMANDLHELLGQSITSPADFNSVLLAAKDGDIVFVDEAHELNKVHPSGANGTDQGEVLPQVFLLLKRQNAGDKVGRCLQPIYPRPERQKGRCIKPSRSVGPR